MGLKRYTDWYGWWIGLRQNILKCIGTTGTAWLGTNAASAGGVPISGISWKQAGVMFLVHIGIEVFNYLQKQAPKVIEEQTNTEFIKR